MFKHKLKIGDQLLLTNELTDEKIVIELDSTGSCKARLGVDAPQHFHVQRMPLGKRCAADPRVADESEAV